MNWLKKCFLIPIFIFTLIAGSVAQPMQSVSAQANGLQVRITQVDTSHFPQVTVYVSATDANGEPVLINPAAILLEENGRVIQPDQINGTGEGGPLTTLLAIDISGSMNTNSKLKNAKTVAQAYIDQIRADDKVALLAFNESITLVQDVTSDQASLSAAIKGLKAADDTAMYDALLKGIDVLNPLDGRKAIIVLTDGIDNHSKHSARDVLQAIGASGLSISTIGLGNPGQSTGNITALDEAGLSALAEQAGGRYGYANDLSSLQSIYEQFGRSLKSEYAITYTSPSTLHDGFNRSLTVSLVGDNLAPLTNPSESKYNPGGVLPETRPGNGNWLLFAGLLVLLVLTLTAPGWLKLLRSSQAGGGKKVEPETTRPAKPRIKLK